MKQGKEKSLVISGATITYTLIMSPRARRIRLQVNREGLCSVVAPEGTREYIITNSIYEKSSWIFKKLEYFSQVRTVSPRINLGSTRDEYLRNKEKARELIEKKLQHFNMFYNVSWQRVSVKNITSRWGSCSKLGNLNFSYKLALLPEPLMDYVVVHEMCHLLELNHGDVFWKHVKKAIPEYNERRKQLKQYI